MNCEHAELPAPAKQSRASLIGMTRRLPTDHTAYLDIHLDRTVDLARAFLHAAWSVARYQIQEGTKPGDRSRYGLTAGDLSVLYHGCRIAGANMVTTLGSENDRLWGELARIKWLAAGTVPAVNSRGAVDYRLTELGQMELLDIFGG